MAPVRTCSHCAEPVPEGWTKKYCSNKCKVAASRARTAKNKLQGEAVSMAEHLAKIKELAKYEGSDSEFPIDIVREVYRDAVRDNINQFVRDSILGATEIMADLLPKALAAVQQDLESKDPFDRRAAYKVLLQYVMPLQKETGDGDSPKTLVVVHGVPVPDTQFGAKYAEEIEAGEVILPDDDDYPQCYVCKDHKHPNLLHKHDNQGGGRMICKSCFARKKYGTNGD